MGMGDWIVHWPPGRAWVFRYREASERNGIAGWGEPAEPEEAQVLAHMLGHTSLSVALGPR